MPSQTIHFDREQYQWLMETTSEDQSMSKRVRKLIEKGKAWEEKHE